MGPPALNHVFSSVVTIFSPYFLSFPCTLLQTKFLQVELLLSFSNDMPLTDQDR